VREATEIARRETQPAARHPGIGIETGLETGERGFVEQSKIFGKS
jgi:hypothetical protein